MFVIAGSGFPDGTTIEKSTRGSGNSYHKRLFVTMPSSGVYETAGVYFVEAAKLGATSTVATFKSDEEGRVFEV